MRVQRSRAHAFAQSVLGLTLSARALFCQVMLFVLTMKRQIKHMIKHRYLPFTRGKQKYTKGGKGSGGAPAKDAK
jgi:hypothetical protein